MSRYQVNWDSKQKSGWYEYKKQRPYATSVEWVFYYQQIIDWIYDTVEGAVKHSRWIIHPEHAVFRFRYERDYLQFILRWS